MEMDTNRPDEFLTDAAEDTSPSYSLEKFYTASRDKKGHDTTIRISLPHSVMDGIARMVAQRVIPEYRTPPDVLRDALVHRLQWLGENFDDLEISELAEILAMETEAQELMRRREAVRSIIDDYDTALRMGSRVEQGKIVAAMRERVRKTRDDTLREGLSSLISKYS